MYMGNHPWVFYKTLYVIHHYLCTVIRDVKGKIMYSAYAVRLKHDQYVVTLQFGCGKSVVDAYCTCTCTCTVPVKMTCC